MDPLDVQNHAKMFGTSPRYFKWGLGPSWARFGSQTRRYLAMCGLASVGAQIFYNITLRSFVRATDYRFVRVRTRGARYTRICGVPWTRIRYGPGIPWTRVHPVPGCTPDAGDRIHPRPVRHRTSHRVLEPRSLRSLHRWLWDHSIRRFARAYR